MSKRLVTYGLFFILAASGASAGQARQALDYVLKTFPGFWVYENCSDEPHNRVGIHFFDYVPQRTRGPDR